MGPPEVHTFEGLDKRASRCSDRLLRAACHEHVAKQSDLATPPCRTACFLIQARAGGQLGEVGRWSHEPGVSEASGSVYGGLGPGAEPDGRPWPLYRARSVAGVRSVKNDLTYASSSSLMPSQARN